MSSRHWHCHVLMAALCVMGWFPAQAAQRLVSTDGAVTEIIFALGAQDQLVGVDTTSLYPPAAQMLPRVGYRRTLTAEGLLALRPDAIIVTPESGPASTLERLELAGVRLLRLPALQQPADLSARIAQVAQWLGRESQGAQLQQHVQQQLQQVQAQLPLPAPAGVLFLLAAGNRGLMVAGKGTEAQKVLDALGLTNLAGNLESYKPLNQEAVMAMQPQLVLVAETMPGAFRLDDWPVLATSPAGGAQRIFRFDSMYLLGFGPRLPAALQDVVRAVQSTAAGLEPAVPMTSDRRSAP